MCASYQSDTEFNMLSGTVPRTLPRKADLQKAVPSSSKPYFQRDRVNNVKVRQPHSRYGDLNGGVGQQLILIALKTTQGGSEGIFKDGTSIESSSVASGMIRSMV